MKQYTDFSMPTEMSKLFRFTDEQHENGDNIHNWKMWKSQNAQDILLTLSVFCLWRHLSEHTAVQLRDCLGARASACELVHVAQSGSHTRVDPGSCTTESESMKE